MLLLNNIKFERVLLHFNDEFALMTFDGKVLLKTRLIENAD
jgi:hypothetical protein